LIKSYFSVLNSCMVSKVRIRVNRVRIMIMNWVSMVIFRVNRVTLSVSRG